MEVLLNAREEKAVQLEDGKYFLQCPDQLLLRFDNEQEGKLRIPAGDMVAVDGNKTIYLTSPVVNTRVVIVKG